MKIVIMGTGPFAVPSCQSLLQAGNEIALVVVRPPVPASGKKKPDAPVQDWATQAGLPVFQPASANAPETLERLRETGAELFFVCDYGQILSRECLAIPPLGGINLHGSLLPRHRGAAPVQWTLLAGDDEAGVSVIHMTPGLDAGPVLTTRKVTIERDENSAELEVRLSQLGAEATLEAIDMLSGWDKSSPIGTVQDKGHATKAPRLKKEDGRLDFSLPAAVLERRIRGYQPWPGAYAELVVSDTKRMPLHLRSARALPSSTSSSSGERPVGAAWSASAAELGLGAPEWSAPWDKLLVVQTGDGPLAVSTVQAAGKRAMSAAEFLRGHPLSPTARFE
ncbi:MAG: methionyl-tRNA formyltransferase [Aureliella sp.]